MAKNFESPIQGIGACSNGSVKDILYFKFDNINDAFKFIKDIQLSPSYQFKSLTDDYVVKVLHRYYLC